MRIDAPEPTLCETCDGVHADTRKRPPTQWLCVHFKRIKGGSFVAPNVWADAEPYLKCRDVNGGACPFWQKRRIAEKNAEADDVIHP